ncbi:ABC transporter ATP-binding protein [Candidatus Methylopumilus planktonicus]|jgi:putative ABC transport system ATP-binding protein|uniref:ABC transporter ATP-binding protein n=1 Tax=Candidatus Methylopumilus planktonicus TaxID=1581557 RepID=UPI00111FFB88|nr:ABC transporter ATP-binding protein [Candidatus Methylopumilus planktonicus]QDD11466.1 ABC transporter ATP-binding protein [Candidatus Methylopumilus planktonicus]QDD23938.1 ABC transporter ATP-binding protein [Candidatus Methylopumilus planktonicus]
MTKKVIEIQGLYKDYDTAAGVFPVLKDVNLAIDDGEYVAIMGPSGSGKSTFMNILGCLDRPTKGEYMLDGHSVKSLSSNELAKLRNKTIGFVFQGFNLLARSTLVENVSLPLVYAEDQKELRTKIAKNILERMGLGNYFDSKPSQISGGQQQRVAIARALVNQPRIILADEPTGNLDSKTSDEIMKIFDELNQIGNTIIIVTHENDIADHASRQVRFLDGKIVEDHRNKKEKVEA